MQFYAIPRLIRSLILQPAALMQKLHSEDFRHRWVLWYYGLILIEVAAFSRALIMSGLVHDGISSSGDLVRLVFVGALFVIMYLITIALSAFLSSRLAPHFHSSVSIPVMRSVIVLAYTPLWLVQPIMIIHPGLSFLGIMAVFYSTFLLGIGVREAGKTASDRVVGFTLASMFIILGISYVLNSFITGIRIF